MKKFTVIKADRLLLWYAIRSLLLSLFCIVVFSLITGEIMLKTDIQLESSKYLSVVICAISAFIVAFCSCKGFKSRGGVLGIISVLPIILYSLFNLMFKNNILIFFLIKLLLVIVIGAIAGNMRIRSNRKFKVK